MSKADICAIILWILVAVSTTCCVATVWLLFTNADREICTTVMVACLVSCAGLFVLSVVLGILSSGEED